MPYLERVATLSVDHCFPGGPSDQILDLFWSSFRCRRKTGVPGEKPAEASLDWKPNAHTAAGTRNRSRDALVQSEEITAALTCSPYDGKGWVHQRAD